MPQRNANPPSRFLTSLALLVIACLAWPGPSRAEIRAQPVWQIEIPAELQGRLFTVVIVPGQPRLVATSPDAILSLDGDGVARTLIRLETTDRGREFAFLDARGRRAGVVLHNHQVPLEFRFLDIGGETLASLKGPKHFRYRIAPRGDAFVGINAGGKHVPGKAERFIYRFYDDSGTLVAEIESRKPQLSDSAFAPDGAHFIINNAAGLSAYRIADGQLVWRAARAFRRFAAAASGSQAAVASGDAERNVVHALRRGDAVWRFALDGPVRNLAISPSGGYIVASDRGKVHLFSADDNEPLWSFAMPEPTLAINSLAVNDAGVVALGAQRNDLTGGVALILDSDGEILFQRALPHERSNAWIPGVRFDETGSLILVRTLERLLLVSLR